MTYGSKVIGLWRSKLNSKFIQRAKSKVAPIFLKIVSNCLSNVRESEKDKFTLSLMSLSWVMDQNVKVTIFFIEITVNSRFCLIMSTPWHLTGGKLLFFYMLMGSRTIWHHFQENWSYLIFGPLYKGSIYLWPSNAYNFRTISHIQKRNTFLKSLSKGE